MLANLTLGDWAVFAGTLIPLLASATVAIIRQIQSGHAQVLQQLHLPSNGTTLGAGLEAIGQKQDMAIGLAHPEIDAPSFVQMARQLTPADAAVAPERRRGEPERRQVEPPSSPTPPGN